MKFSPPRPVKAVVRDVTAERAFTTVYQNLTGRPLLAFVNLTCRRDTVGGYGYAQAYTGAASPPTDVRARVGLDNPQATEAVNTINATLAFAVPNGHYYRVLRDGSGTLPAITSWIEVEL